MTTLAHNGLPTVTVIIPMLNEDKYIGRCIQSVLDQDYPRDLIEIIVVDGGSNDDSINTVKELKERHPNIKLLGGAGTNCPTGMNIGLENARGEIICKVDAHGYVAPDFLKKGVEHLSKNDDIKCVGGPINPITETFIQKVNALVRSSLFGVGGGANVLENNAKFVDSVQCGIYERQILDEVGFFDGSLQFGEDEEINWRIIKAGYKIFSTPEIKFYYYPRNSFKKLFKQYFNYGMARLKVIKKHPDFLRIKHLIPSVFLLSLLVSSILTFFHLFSFWILLLIVLYYLLFSFTFSILISKKAGWRYIWVLPIGFVCLHLGYGLGFLLGAFNFKKQLLATLKEYQKSNKYKLWRLNNVR